MRTFTYIGNHDETTVFGVTFKKGEATQVEDEQAAKKLAGNPDFKEGSAAPRGEEQKPGEQKGAEHSAGKPLGRRIPAEEIPGRKSKHGDHGDDGGPDAA